MKKFLFAIAILLFSIAVRPQCVQNAVTTNAVRGETFGMSGIGKEILSDVKIELRKAEKKSGFVRYSDIHGQFSFPTMPAGSYLLDVYSPNFPRFILEITVTSKRRKAAADFLLVQLELPGSGVDPCSGNIRLRK